MEDPYPDDENSARAGSILHAQGEVSKNLPARQDMRATPHFVELKALEN